MKVIPIAALPLIFFIMGLLLVFIIIWLMLAIYQILIGTISLIPPIISRKQSGSIILISSAIIQVLSGIILAFSCIYSIIRVFDTDAYKESETVVSTSDYKLLFAILVTLLILALMLSLAGAVLSIVRAVKSSKKRIVPKSITLATLLTSIPAALIFAVFSSLILAAVFSL